jgi:hypothetical protein
MMVNQVSEEEVEAKRGNEKEVGFNIAFVNTFIDDNKKANVRIVASFSVTTKFSNTERADFFVDLIKGRNIKCSSIILTIID